MSAKSNLKGGFASLLSQVPESVSPEGWLGTSITGQPLPPVEAWSPSHCGDIDIEIRSDGSWWHEGTLIKRFELVRLFASILIREGNDFFLVTPVEKVRIRVASHPLVIIDAEPTKGGDPAAIVLTLNTGGQVVLSEALEPAPEPSAGGAFFVTLERGLTALFSRPAWYRFVDLANAQGEIHSAGSTFSLI